MNTNNANKTGFVLTSGWQPVADLVRREIGDIYTTKREQAAYRAGMSTAAYACDHLADQSTNKNLGGRLEKTQAHRCGDAITELRKLAL